mgnify:CR=1 FL=1
MAASLLGFGLTGCQTEELEDDLTAPDLGRPADVGAPSDAGDRPDAGGRDLGTDVGVEDAGEPLPGPEYGLPPPPDAGRPDLGSPDQGSADLGSPDAGAQDAGSPDQGSADAGEEPGADVGPAPLYGLPPSPDAGR